MGTSTEGNVHRDFDDDHDSDICDRCGGDGFIMAWEGDGSDWGEDTYCGQMDAVIECRACNGRGYIS